jgi:hypothetical protein
MRSQYSGGGRYRPIYFGSGEISPGILHEGIVLRENGDVLLGGDYESEHVRLIARSTILPTNRFEIEQATTGFWPNLRARGVDADVGIVFDTKGQGSFIFTQGSFSSTVFQIHGINGTSNLAVGASSSNAPFIQAEGVGSNIDVQIIPKGSGLVRFGTHSELGSETVTGYITIRDSSGTTRKLAVVS